jgi:hypothetical protein
LKRINLRGLHEINQQNFQKRFVRLRGVSWAGFAGGIFIYAFLRIHLFWRVIQFPAIFNRKAVPAGTHHQFAVFAALPGKF